MNLSLEPQEQTTVGRRRIMGSFLQSSRLLSKTSGDSQVASPLAIVSITSFLCSLASLPKLKEFTLYPGTTGPNYAGISRCSGDGYCCQRTCNICSDSWFVFPGPLCACCMPDSLSYLIYLRANLLHSVNSLP